MPRLEVEPRDTNISESLLPDEGEPRTDQLLRRCSSASRETNLEIALLLWQRKGSDKRRLRSNSHSKSRSPSTANPLHKPAPHIQDTDLSDTEPEELLRTCSFSSRESNCDLAFRLRERRESMSMRSSNSLDKDSVTDRERNAPTADDEVEAGEENQGKFTLHSMRLPSARSESLGLALKIRENRESAVDFSQKQQISVAEALQKRQPDVEDLLRSLGLCRVEERGLSRIPLRFLQNPSRVRGINLQEILKRKEEEMVIMNAGQSGYRGLLDTSKMLVKSSSRPAGGVIPKLLEKLCETGYRTLKKEAAYDSNYRKITFF